MATTTWQTFLYNENSTPALTKFDSSIVMWHISYTCMDMRYSALKSTQTLSCSITKCISKKLVQFENFSRVDSYIPLTLFDTWVTSVDGWRSCCLVLLVLQLKAYWTSNIFSAYLPPGSPIKGQRGFPVQSCSCRNGGMLHAKLVHSEMYRKCVQPPLLESLQR